MILLAPLFWPSETDFRLLASKTVSEQTSEALCHSVCGHLLQQPQETHTIYARIFSVFSPKTEWKVSGQVKFLAQPDLKSGGIEVIYKE